MKFHGNSQGIKLSGKSFFHSTFRIINVFQHFEEIQDYYNMKIKFLAALILTLATHQLSQTPIIHFHVHQWCPPCKKILSICSKLQKTFLELQFQTHRYTNKTLLVSNDTVRSLPFPTIIFQCNNGSFRYQNDLTFTQLSYWINVVCLRKMPECTDKINDQLYHILMVKKSFIQEDLLAEMISHPHIKICSTSQSNITSQKTIQILRDTDRKTLYFDYFSHNIRQYLINSNKIALAILTNEKNTSRVNSFLQSYANLNNFMNQKDFNQTTSFYHYDLPQRYKQKLVFLELCQNINISKCIYQTQRRYQVQNNQKIIDKLLHFLDIQTDGGFQRVFAFKFQYPVLEKHIYHNFGNLDERFIFWINQIASKENKRTPKRHCYWNTITHRLNENSLEDFESHLILFRFIQNRNKNSDLKPFPLNKSIKSYHSQPKLTLCIQGKSPVSYENNRQIRFLMSQIESYDKLQISDQL